MLAGLVVHTKAELGRESFTVTTASGPLRDALTDPNDPLAQHFGLPAQTVVLFETGVRGVWSKAQ
jgi:hypothetical protein